jgi:hypothetical protein
LPSCALVSPMDSSEAPPYRLSPIGDGQLLSAYGLKRTGCVKV